MLGPVVVFFLMLLLMGVYVRHRDASRRKENFSKDYYIGSRSLGGFVLAMSLVATYGSVSSFLSGPGVAWEKGFGWVLFASTQIVAAFLVLGVIGKKMAVLARKIDAVTIVDLVRHRYQSNLLANLCALVILMFFTAQMLGQFIGGAQIFAAVTDMSYTTGLCFFAIVVIIYTVIGGFNAVAITDTACAVVMLTGMFFLGYAIITEGGGIDNIMRVITDVSAQADAGKGGYNMLEPTASGSLPIQLFITQWMLCGICTIGLPQSAVRCISYRDTQSVHRAMVIGTIVCGAMMVGMHMLGVLARGVITQPISELGGSTDAIVPMLISGYMHPLLAGFTIIGPLAATMSTVSSLLIAGSSAVVKDIYMHYKNERQESIDQKKVARISTMITALMGVATLIMAINPPDIIVWINLFAFGGLETAFFWTLLFGFFWSRANSTGAIWGLVGGLAAYCITMALGIKLGSFHNILIGIGTGFIMFVVGSYVGKATDQKVLRLFFPEKY